MWFKRNRQRRATWRRFSALADRIGARTGQVIDEYRSGGPLNVTSLSILTFRPGTAHEVAQAQVDAALAIGYTDPPLLQPERTEFSTGFGVQDDLPMLTIHTFSAGTTIRGTDIIVPTGHTGVIVTFS